jgi:hypothetical protein
VLFCISSMPFMGLSIRLLGLAAAVITVSPSLRAQTLALPEPGNGAARLVSFTGQISILRDGNTWALNLGDLIQPQQVIVTGADGYGIFKVSDGSTFEVFAKSRVVFRQNRGDWKDLLEVWLGKVRVQIEHPGGLPNNNKLRTPSAVISVRGTIFDVEVEDEDATTLVLDEEGQVAVQHALKAGGEARILNPGEYIRVYKNDPIAKKLIDKGNMLQRAARMASDAAYQVALDAAHNAGTIARTSPGPVTGPTSPGDHKSPTPPPPAPPPPPSPPPPPLK